MTNEAVNIELPTIIVSRNIADGTAIAKGTLLKLSGQNIGISANLDSMAFGGITVEEKTASDGITNIAVAMDGVYDLVVATGSTAITCGAGATMSGTNLVRLAVEADYPLGAVIGNFEEPGAAGDTLRVRLK